MSIFYKFKQSLSILSANVLFKNASLTLEEKQIEFFQTNFESGIRLKYIPISDSIKPDLMFVYDFSNDYKEKYIAPQTYSFPIWSNGTTTTINSKSNTNINTNGDLNVSANVYGNKNTTITQSGKWEITKVQRPSYTVGQYFPNFSLTIYDTSNNNKIWEGNANGTSTNKDFRLSAQLLIGHLFSKIPKGSYIDPLEDKNNGVIGIGYRIYNSNGMSFYPVILTVFKNSPADAKGFRKYDVILSVNGEQTINKSMNKIADMFRGEAGTKMDLLIDRKGKEFKKTLFRVKRESLKN